MPVPAEAAFQTIPELGAALRRGDYTAVELAEFYLDRLERLGPQYNALVTLTRDLALQQAAMADADFTAGRDRGPLHGIPYGAKDLLAVPGYPTTWGAAPLRDQLLDGEATAVRRLREAGGVLVAKLAMVELAGGLGYQQADASFTGPGLNPWDPSRWSGGSSTGPGSAVAAGLVPFAIGSETWGSIMTPASFCGVTGLRPTYGRVSKAGAMTLSWTMDKLGPLARSAEDCGLILQALAGPDPADDSTLDAPFDWTAQGASPSRRYRFGILSEGLARTQPEVAANFQAAVDVLREVADVEETGLPGGLPYNAVADIILSAEAAAVFEPLIRAGDLEAMTAPEDRWRIYPDLLIPAVDYIQALRLRRVIQQRLEAWLAPFDALLAPTLSTVAGPIDQPFATWSAGFSSTELGGAANLAGLPAVSVPNGLGAGGLPTGLQIVGRALAEGGLLAVAREYQTRTDWHRRRPPEA